MDKRILNLDNYTKKGHVSPFKGRKHTIEARRKVSLSLIGKPGRNTGSHWKDTEETKLKKSLAKKGKLPKNFAEFNKLDRKWSGSLGAKARYEKYPTSLEKTFYDLLIVKGIIFEKQKIIDNKYCVDVYIPGLNLIIEVDGKDHNSKMIKMKDKEKDKYYKNKGYRILRISEKEINDPNLIERSLL